MLKKELLRKIFGSKNDRELKKLLPLVQDINALEPKIRALSDAQLQSQTGILKQKLASGASLDQILVEAFAVCREAGARVLGMRHFDVQLVGAMALHRGMISEMKTGEGKTLVATLASYLNALSGKGVHVVTVNDYLARRDSDWMGRIHKFLGLDVGCILANMSDSERKKQYAADITYGTNNEYGFDYLRDNMKPSLDLYVQRDLNFAIVDEVDSILIDEARTPLIISGPSEENIDLYSVSDRAVRNLKRDVDYSLDEKHRSVTLTEDGVLKLEKVLNVENLYAPENTDLVHKVHASLRAHAVFRKDIDYVVRDGQVIIVDEFTGRLMSGRRWSDGLHQAVEAKEGVKIEAENQTLATVTLQNYFRMYKKLSGMTGTADTEAAEFQKIYNLGVLLIPGNKPMIREDSNDLVYRNEAGKYRAVVEDIKEKYEKGRPVLVGTVSIAKSERVSKLLGRMGIPHNVLNAKQHEREAEIIASAGERSSVTIATNMAGRGTDIILGPGVPEIGGLHVIGTERHESRRIDNQLRGRAGRQGDKGSSQFYLSLEDDLMRIFAKERVVAIMDRLGMEEDVPIQAGMVTKSIENAQKKVESHHFDQREHLLKYDDVLNKQREVIYSMRRLVLEGKETKSLVLDLSRDFAGDIVSQFCDDKQPSSQWGWVGLVEAIKASFGIDADKNLEKKLESQSPKGALKSSDVHAWLVKEAEKVYEAREKSLGEKTLRELERYFLIRSIDHHWKEHLLALDHLKEGIHLRGYAQKDPLVEYRKEGFALFKLLDKAIRQGALSQLFTVRLANAEDQAERQRAEDRRILEEQSHLQMSGPSLDESPQDMVQDLGGGGASPAPRPSGVKDSPAVPDTTSQAGLAAAASFMKAYQEKRLKQLNQAQAGDGVNAAPSAPVVNKEEKVGRNDPCPCGSGKKYKQCHGK